MLFSNEEFAQRFLDAFAAIDADDRTEYTVVVEHGRTGLPRASSIFDCARKQYYDLTETPQTNVGSPVYNWPTHMGFAGQEVVTNILRRMGYEVTVPGLIIVRDVLSVHPDGDMTGLDLGEDHALFDSKVRNVYGLEKLLSSPMPQADVPMYGQMQVGMEAIDAEVAIVTAHPHDYSTFKNAVTRRKTPMVMASPLVNRIIIEKDQFAQDLAVDRATALLAAKGLGMMVPREHNPAAGTFPCSWSGGGCPWIARCLADDMEGGLYGEGFFPVPELPAEWLDD